MLKHFLSKKYWFSIKTLLEASIVRQNKNSFLGSAWGLVQPFTHVIIISYFFGFLLRQPSEVMIMNLVGSLPLWNFLINTMTSCANSLISRETILKKIIISKTLFPISDSLVQAYTLVYSFLAMYIAFVLMYPEHFSWTIIFVPFVALPFIISVISASVAVSFLTPYIRDIPQMLNVVLNITYWTLPIIYPYSMVPESKKIFFEINPAFLLLRPVQDLILYHQLPDFIALVKAVFVCFCVSFVSFLLYKRFARNVVYYL